MTPPTHEPTHAAAWWNYVQHVARGDNNQTIAAKVGITGPSVGRWRVGGVDAGTATRFAKVYGRPPIEALIAAGYITEREAGAQPVTLPSLDEFTDQELISEVQRRMASA